jgi:hypothetical protein
MKQASVQLAASSFTFPNFHQQQQCFKDLFQSVHQWAVLYNNNIIKKFLI